ncbi:MAG: thiamine-phosphate synthase family protein [Dehalococcoidales bacterium]|nr:thiamine-phosphate synthase family protein [Dehalococcoidales bacterium]
MNKTKEAEAILGNLVMALHILEDCAEFSALIPEVRTNIAYALTNAQTQQEVAAFPGRITNVRGYPHVIAAPNWGASDHLARRIIESRKYDKSVNAIINFKFEEKILHVVQEYCQKEELLLGWLDRSEEPLEVSKRDQASMPWKVEQLFSKYGAMPRIYYEGPGWGKEPLFLAQGKDAVEVVSIAVEIARQYKGCLL